MAYPKRSTIWNPNRQIGNNSQHPVGHGRFKGEIMRDLMDGQEQVLVGSGSDHICGDEKGP